MSSDQNFNPYYRWLGIPEDIEHPDHYQLLGIAQFEDSVEVISNAADTRMLILRTFQTGKYSEISQRVLNEVSAARVCLLNAEKKAEYDNELRIEVLTKLEKVFLAQESEVQTSDKATADDELSVDDDDDELSIDDDAPRISEAEAKKMPTVAPAKKRPQAPSTPPAKAAPAKSVPIPVKASSKKTPPTPFKKEVPDFTGAGKSSSGSSRRSYTARKKSSSSTTSVVIGSVVSLIILAILLYVLMNR